MKKLITLFLAAAIIASAPAALAAPQVTAVQETNDTSNNDTEAMKNAIIAVKQKVDIPEKLTEFTSSVSDTGKKVVYDFMWYEKDGEESIRVICDENGYISYIRFDDGKNDYTYEQKLPSISKADIELAAEEYLKKYAPETMVSENDTMKVIPAQGNIYNSSYTVQFERQHNGSAVVGDNAFVTVDISEDTPKLESISINYTYNAKFEDEAEEISGIEDAYRKLFPEELVYQKNFVYSMYRTNPDYDGEIRLVYRLKNFNNGYMSAYTGEKVEETYDNDNGVMPTERAAADSASGGASLKNESLSESELTELDNIASLYSPAAGEAFLRKIPQLKLDNSVKKNSDSLYCINREKKEYELRLNFKDEDNSRNTSARFDAKRNRLTNLYNYMYSDKSIESAVKPLTEKEIADGEKQIDSFLNAVIKDKLAEFKKDETEQGEKYCIQNSYTRMVNDIPYISNTIRVGYDHDNKMISNYNLNYEDDAVFADPSSRMSGDDAYALLLEKSPLKKCYVHSGDTYKLVYTMPSPEQFDAFTGADLYEYDSFNPISVEYDDIDGHWCADAVNELRDFGIALKGSSFNPDSEITQSDLLRLFYAGIKDKSAVSYDDDTLYERCQNNKILSKEERADDAAITREQAFIYMIRLAGYEKVAQLQNIYKIEYADGDMISDGNIGYAAILSGMGILYGDGGMLRPQDKITRAEAATMIYKYMK